MSVGPASSLAPLWTSNQLRTFHGQVWSCRIVPTYSHLRWGPASKHPFCERCSWDHHKSPRQSLARQHDCRTQNSARMTPLLSSPIAVLNYWECMSSPLPTFIDFHLVDFMMFLLCVSSCPLSSCPLKTKNNQDKNIVLRHRVALSFLLLSEIMQRSL